MKPKAIIQIENLAKHYGTFKALDNLNLRVAPGEIYGFLGGIGISFPLPEKFIADVRILGGYQNSKSPEISLTGESQDTYVKIEGKTISSPVYFGSASVRYPIANSLYLNFGFQYIASTGKFENVKSTTSIDGEVSESTISFDRTMDAWGLNVGLKYFIL